MGQVVLAVVLVGLASWLFARQFTAEHVSKQVPVRCESCGHEYVPDKDELDPECPRCHARTGLRLLYYRCKACGATFVAYEQDSARDVIRQPGGEWMPLTACDFLPTCPECSSDLTEFIKNPEQAATSDAQGE